jgi:hypothetical protein
MGVPIATCVEFDNAGIKPSLLVLRKRAMNHHDMRFPFLASSYAFYRHLAMQIILELSCNSILIRYSDTAVAKSFCVVGLGCCLACCHTHGHSA